MEVFEKLLADRKQVSELAKLEVALMRGWLYEVKGFGAAEGK